MIIGEHIEYLSSDSGDKSETIESCHFSSLTIEFLNSLTTSSLPNHSIKLKIGSPIMLLRNLDQTQGLCNGTRLIITRLAKHVIAAEIIFGKNYVNCYSPVSLECLVEVAHGVDNFQEAPPLPLLLF